MSNAVDQATYGNRNGSHQLLDSTLPMSSPALEDLRFHVDRPAGHLDSSVAWSPYWGCQPVGEWWAVWRGEEDPGAPRKNMVRVKVALLPLSECGRCSDLTSLLTLVGHDGPLGGAEFAGTVVERLAATDSPVAIPDLSIAPGLLAALWPRLWARARRELSLRTVFASESLNIATPPKIALFPAELLARWRNSTVIPQPEPCSSPAGRWFAGEVNPQLKRLLEENATSLPGNFSVLLRLNRLVEKLDLLRSEQGSLADALLVVRTQEAFPGGLRLPVEDTEVVGEVLLKLAGSTAGEIRTASLTRLDDVPDRGAVESAVARWTESQLAHAADQDALWILQHHLSSSHSEWWRNGVSRGLTAAVEGTSDSLASAVWRWLELRPQALEWLRGYLGGAGSIEAWLAVAAPDLPQGKLLEEVTRLCSEMDWAKLLATVLRGRRPLSDVVSLIRRETSTPDAGLDAVLENRGASEVVAAATTTGWLPLLEKAAEITRAQPQLFGAVEDQPAVFALLLSHVRRGGQFPEELLGTKFLARVFDGLLNGADDATEIAAELPSRAGGFALGYEHADQLLARVNADVLAGATEAWWTRFTGNENVAAPPEPIHDLIIDSVSERTKGAPITLVIRLLERLPAIEESTFTEWMLHTGLFWEDGDHQRVAQVLEAKHWKSAVTMFRRSWKLEIKLVAWYAKSLLSWSDRFWWPPTGATSNLVPREYGTQTSAHLSASQEEEPMDPLDVGIVTMKEEEYDALLDKFGPTRPVAGANRDYDVAAISTSRGECRVAITRCAQQGNAYAQAAATEMLSDVNPRFLLVVGIAGGVPTVDFCLGDVVVSDYIQDLTLEDTGTSPGSERYNALGGPLHPTASRIVERLRAIERSALGWNSDESVACRRPGLEGAHTTDDSDWNASIDETLAHHAQRNSPISTARKIASSDRLIKAPELLQRWRQVLKAVAVVEMESAGAYVPCQRNGVPFMAIRGISDIVGWKRDEAWTLYACHTAAAYAKMLVGAGVFVPDRRLGRISR